MIASHLNMMFGVHLIWVVILCITAGIGGFVDAIAGGGSLLTIPALLFSGLDPLTVIATNKFLSLFGSVSASIKFSRARLIVYRDILPMLPIAVVGAVLGAIVVQHINTRHLMQVVPIALILIAFYLLWVKNFGQAEHLAKMSKLVFTLSIPFIIGVWDGLMGPATGSLFALAFTALLGQSLLKGTAHAKVLNATTNISATVVFTLSGHILWLLGGAMALSVFIGAWLGAQTAIKRGSQLIRILLVIISLIMSLKLMQQYW